MENDTCADSDVQSTPDTPDVVEEQVNEREARLDSQGGLHVLGKRIDERCDDMIHLRAARLVLEHTDISEAQAAALVETMQDVDRRMQDDDARREYGGMLLATTIQQ